MSEQKRLYVAAPHFEAFEIYRDNAFYGRRVVDGGAYLMMLQQAYNLRDVNKQSWWSATGLIVGTAMANEREKARAENQEG